MPRAFLVKKRRERPNIAEHDLLPQGTPSFDKHTDVNPVLTLSDAKPERGINGESHANVLLKSSVDDNDRNQSENIATDEALVMSVVSIDQQDRPLDLSNQRTGPVPSKNLPSSPRSAFQPVQRIIHRPNHGPIVRQNLKRAFHLHEFFEQPNPDTIRAGQSHNATTHELIYFNSKKILAYEQKLPMFNDSRRQSNEDYFYKTWYGQSMPMPFAASQIFSKDRPIVLETDGNTNQSNLTIPTPDGSPYCESPPEYKQNTLELNPKNVDGFDNKSENPSTLQSELMGGSLHREFLKQHLVSIRGSMYMGKQGQRQARPPVPGLEYIQNGSDTKLRDIIESESKGIGEDDAERLVKTEPRDSAQDDEPVTVEGSLASSRTDSATDVKLQQEKRYKCDVCGKGFSRSNTLVTHKRIHTGDKPFKCELCGRAFRQPGNLTRHRLTHTTVKPYVCSQCGKAFNRASNLHTHMRTHTNYKPFVCQYCGKGFHQKIDMKIHSYTHTGEKPHKCKKCGRGFKQLTHLTYHMRTHSDVKMYTCAYCGKGFNQKGNLQAHIYGHTGERPYKCEICGKGFTLASTLNTHRRTHADRKPFICQHCGKDFYQKNALKSHMIASHPLIGPECVL